MLWTLATRSVIARRRRTVFVMLSLALSSFVLVVGSSVLTSFKTNIEAGLRHGLIGDLQIYHAANTPPQLMAEVPAGSLTLVAPESVMRFVREDPNVAVVSPRSMVSGMLLVDELSAPVTLMGIDPHAEASLLSRLIPDNARMSSSFDGILLGRALAARLQRAGGVDEVTALIPTADGMFEGDSFRVEGIYSPSGLPLIDEFIAFVPLTRLQSLLGDEGYPGSLIVRLRDGADLSHTLDRLRRAFQAHGWPLEISTWEELAGNLLSMVQVGQYLLGSGFLLLLLVVVVGVGNSFLVMMLDRTQEIGLMRALGTARLSIVVALLAEVTLVSAAASGVGALLGVGVCSVLGHFGIPAATQAMTYAFGGERFFPEVHLAVLIYGFLLVTLTGPVAAIVPAAYASATDPAETMRTSA